MNIANLTGLFLRKPRRDLRLVLDGPVNFLIYILKVILPRKIEARPPRLEVAVPPIGLCGFVISIP